MDDSTRIWRFAHDLFTWSSNKQVPTQNLFVQLAQAMMGLTIAALISISSFHATIWCFAVTGNNIRRASCSSGEDLTIYLFAYLVCTGLCTASYIAVAHWFVTRIEKHIQQREQEEISRELSQSEG